MQPIRQGDVILKYISPANNTDSLPKKILHQRKILPHLTLAEGEVTGHRHRIADGQAELYEENGTLYLRVLSETARLVHEEHKAIEVPQGIWQVRIQREYVGTEEVFRTVSD